MEEQKSHESLVSLINRKLEAPQGLFHDSIQEIRDIKIRLVVVPELDGRYVLSKVGVGLLNKLPKGLHDAQVGQ
jgi:hypothetical protein